MLARKAELLRLIRQQKRDQESDGMGRGWIKHKTYSVDFQYIENVRDNLNPFQREVAQKLVSRQDKDIRYQANFELILKGLPKKERFIIKRKLKGYTLEEIARELNTYKMEISRILDHLRPRFGLKKKGVKKG